MRIEDLITLERHGELPEFVLFWGGGHGKGCLSQWHRSPYKVDGVTYPTAEHYMMAEKARLFGDTASAEKILATTDPRRAKALGRRVAGFDEDTWVRERYGIVVRGNMAKFGAHARLRDHLSATTGKVLVEASPLDTIWGIGFDENQPEALRPSEWRGLNLLGFALMDVREALTS
jgi:ribA/ribD-fused uncharacterized protein